MAVVDNVGSATDLATMARDAWLISTTIDLPAHSAVPTRFDSARTDFEQSHEGLQLSDKAAKQKRS